MYSNKRKRRLKKAVENNISPGAKKLLDLHPELDIYSITPTGVNGLIKKDIELALQEMNSEEE